MLESDIKVDDDQTADYGEKKVYNHVLEQKYEVIKEIRTVQQSYSGPRGSNDDLFEHCQPQFEKEKTIEKRNETD